MRTVLFRAPYPVTSRAGTTYHALVNGKLIQGDFGTVDRQFKDAEKAHSKALREKKNAPDFTVTIMADYGMAPYAWIKPASDTTPFVGTSCAGFGHQPTAFDISTELHDKLVGWCTRFERDCDQADFDWTEFHRQGIEMATQLKAAIGPRFAIVYHKPTEDPDCHLNPATPIT